MSDRPPISLEPSTRGRGTKVWERAAPILALGLALLAYRPLFLRQLVVPGEADIARWIYVPDEKAPALVLGIALWLFWRRRARLFALPPRRSLGAGFTFGTIGVGLFVWSQLTRTPLLLAPSLACSGLSLLLLVRGWQGVRVAGLPALALLFAMQIPAPIRHELVWQLQVATARGAALVLPLISESTSVQGVMLHVGDRNFVVIDSCSGLRGIEILLLAALVTRELFADTGRRQWLLLLVAPPLGFVLNLLRIVLIVTNDDPAVAREHSTHGLFVLAIGTGLLYVLGLALSATRSRDRRQNTDDELVTGLREPRERGPSAGNVRWDWVVAGLGCLGVLSFALSPFPGTEKLSWSNVELPRQQAGWTARDIEGDPMFHGALFSGPTVHRRYEKRTGRQPPMVVDVFIGLEIARHEGSSRLFTSRIALPNRTWSIAEARPARLWGMARDAELVLASDGDSIDLAYVWRVRDEGMAWEIVRDALALESSPLRRDPPRALVRISTPLLRNGPVARDRAKQMLDRFITEFREPLAGI